MFCFTHASLSKTKHYICVGRTKHCFNNVWFSCAIAETTKPYINNVDVKNDDNVNNIINVVDVVI